MKFKNNSSPIFLTAVTLMFLFACRQGNSDNSATQAASIEPVEITLSIDTFSTFPPEIDGCSCCFSSNSKEFKSGEYIYMNDYAQTSFIIINGVLTKFTKTDFKEVDSSNVKATYISDHYELTIESKDGIQNGDETWLRTGVIAVKNKKGQSVSKTFYGECGC